jgi:glycosyltransferase involved in cell wall biosynthesis
MAVYNDESYIGEAIESILCQTFRDFELVVVDDASTDDTAAIVDGYAKRDARIRVIRNEQNLGRSAARNVGIAAAKAELLAFQDGDDLALPRRVELQKQYMDDHPDDGIVASGWIVIDDEKQKVCTCLHKRSADELVKRLRRHQCIGHWACMYRTGIVKSVGGYREGFRAMEDYDMLLRITERASLGVLDIPVYKYRKVMEGVSIANPVSTKHFEAIAREFARQRAVQGEDDYGVYLREGQFPRIEAHAAAMSRAVYYYKLAFWALRCREWPPFFRYMVRGFVRNPLWCLRHALRLTGIKLRDATSSIRGPRRGRTRQIQGMPEANRSAQVREQE